MDPEAVPAELLKIREEIDSLDSEIVKLLADRFVLTHRVGELKASHALDALDSSREAEKLARIADLCKEKGLNSELVADLFVRIMEEVKRNHERLRGQ